ncbi:GDSL-like Lipase/Acylhydrolase family protein [Pseudonocardia thermophila]|jgi:GDSL-like Lipase/Acylhydrolase.|uniref:GDSL-like Lipase/Acylhydrolase family protein n=1 Tax=Pseudonocardia thermophila TaxID=1848 RepID=A0A1M6NGC6_PSETH|nr:SGNH/GDSL hydrolase family protein [Pseudonocardia thermophila]SHJ94684.1 GDSL-like Lipase/Acylhydrolase family protein [Pseudonocardia thermophila]
MSVVAAAAATIVLTATPAAAANGRYVALGDSFTAAPLVPVQHGVPFGCFRSDSNYPSHVAKQLGKAKYRDVSCSGATTENMTSPQQVADGANPPQFDALGPDVSLVTLTIGGNDVGFAGIIEECVVRSPLDPHGSACKDYYTAGGKDQLAERIKKAAPKIAATLRGIAERAPSATIAILGYPAILPDKGPGCFPIVPFSPGDVAYLRETEKRLNAMIEEQAHKAGVIFVDTYTPSIGHDACQEPGVKWIEGLVPTAAAAPFHPNDLGTKGMAEAALAALGA